MIDRFIKVFPETELINGGAKAAEIDGREIMFVRSNNKIYALENVCSHDGGRLGEGGVVDGHIECPRHGGRFDLETGHATKMPAIAPIKTFEVKIEKGDVFIALQ